MFAWPCLFVDGLQCDHSPCAKKYTMHYTILRSIECHGNMDPDFLTLLHRLFDLFCYHEFDCRHILTRIIMLMHS